MATEFFIHKMTEHMETARIVHWLVKEGDPVRQYQVIMEVETEKATVEMEAPAAGVIRNIHPDAVEGAEVKVGQTLCWIAAPDEAVPSIFAISGLDAPNFAMQASNSPSIPQRSISAAQGPEGAIRATPMARSVAKKLGVDLALVKGTGPNGIIRDGDVRASAATQPEPVMLTGLSAKQETLAQPGEWIELNRIRAVTGQRMLQSIQTAPQFSLSIEADVTNLLWIQEALQERIQSKTGQKLSITALLVKAIAEALKKHPLANASYEEDPSGRPGVRLHPDINLGVAVGTEQGLVVPVIRRADQCLLEDVTNLLEVFAEKAAGMHFAPADLDGGTFTLSNLGMYGIVQFTAILNPPQSAILAAGKITRRPVELAEGGMGLRSMMCLTLTVDHRVVDGLQAALFLAEIQNRIEKPYFLL